jgi:hypothetical protein
MWSSLLPPTADNTFAGRKAGLWLLGLLLLAKTVMSVNAIFLGGTVATKADGIPLDAYAPAAARAVVALFAAWGLAQLMICLVGVLVLVRYRALVPLTFVLLLAEHLGRRLIFFVMPIERVGSPPSPAIQLGLLAVMVAGLALSLWRSEARLRAR